ncbi:hypothetical protein BT93_J1640 [Corymbia citriodora subsp. variegata]|nr:hypothetical protein BT93_J1640 [Corymbia citriodora subsp. variegata]
MFRKCQSVHADLHRLLWRRDRAGQLLRAECIHARADEGGGRRASEKSARQARGPEFQLHKSKGQHILTNPRVLDSIVRRADLKPGDTVLEIGPGTGNLTLKLLEASRKVVAVEIDGRMVDVLWKRVAECGFEDRLTVIQKDALKTQFPPFDIVVANIPYQISSPLVIKLVYGKIQFRSATLLLQKEFARRLLANPGDSEYNRLAVNVKLVADVEFAMDVSKRDFLPVPKVDSSVVIIHPKTELPNVNLAEWWAFTRTCFGKKNKTLGATFKQKRKVMEILKTSTVAGLRKDVTIDDNDGISRVSIEGGDMDEEGNSEEKSLSSSIPEGEMNLFKEKIVGVLRAEGFEDKRPSKLSNDELLHLLAVLNRAGVFFHNQAESQNALLADV